MKRIDIQSLVANYYQECREANPPETILAVEIADRASQAQAELTKKEIVEDLETFICDECSTPNFVNIVLPKEKWQALKGS